MYQRKGLAFSSMYHISAFLDFFPVMINRLCEGITNSNAMDQYDQNINRFQAQENQDFIISCYNEDQTEHFDGWGG